MDHLSEVMQIIEGARRGDMRKVSAYTELLAKKLEEDGDKRAASGLLRVLRGEGGHVNLAPVGAGASSPACEEFAPGSEVNYCSRPRGHRGEHRTRWLPSMKDGRLVERYHWRPRAKTAALTIQTKGSVQEGP